MKLKNQLSYKEDHLHNLRRPVVTGFLPRELNKGLTDHYI